MRTLSFLLLFSIWTLTGCNKQEVEGQSRGQAVQAVEKLYLMEDEAYAFGLLTIDERVDLAERHLQFCIEYYDLSDNQIAILNRVIQDLPNIYASTEENPAPELIELELDVNQYFSGLADNTRQVIFNSMVTSDADVAAIAPPNPNDATPECNCSQSSNWCNSAGPSSGIHIPCGVKKCKGGPFCGTMLAFRCNGRCNLFG